MWIENIVNLEEKREKNKLSFNQRKNVFFLCYLLVSLTTLGLLNIALIPSYMQSLDPIPTVMTLKRYIDLWEIDTLRSSEVI